MPALAPASAPTPTLVSVPWVCEIGCRLVRLLQRMHQV
jgi:hypothetical protein